MIENRTSQKPIELIPPEVKPASTVSTPPSPEPRIDSALTKKIKAPPQSEGLNRPLDIVRVSAKINEDPKDPSTQKIAAQLEEIERTFGVRISTVPSTTVWAEDPGIPLGEKGYLAVNFNRDRAVDYALKRLELYGLPTAATGQGRTAERGVNGLETSEGEQTAQQMIDAGYQVQQSRVFLEGGNVLAAGDKVIIGKSSLIVSMEILDRRGEFNPRQIEQLAQSRNWSDDQLNEARLMASNLRSRTGKPEGTDPQIDDEAKQILAKMEITKEVISQELNVKPRDIVVVSQPTFHIDMQMRPLENRVILLNDPRLANRMIEDLLNDKTVRLNEQEREALEEMKFGPKLLRELGLVLDKSRKELEAAGFRVIAAPGNSFQSAVDDFTDENGKLRPYRSTMMNNMNGTIGRTPSGIILYLTNSSGIPALDDAQARWLRGNTSIQAVVFMDHELLIRDGGWDCITVGNNPFEEIDPVTGDSSVTA
jgi:hypothetical protein